MYGDKCTSGRCKMRYSCARRWHIQLSALLQERKQLNVIIVDERFSFLGIALYVALLCAIMFDVDA